MHIIIKFKNLPLKTYPSTFLYISSSNTISINSVIITIAITILLLLFVLAVVVILVGLVVTVLQYRSLLIKKNYIKKDSGGTLVYTVLTEL